MKSRLNSNLFYTTLESVPISNYIQYRKYLSVYAVIGSSLSDLLYLNTLLKAQKFLGNDVKQKILETNISVLKQLILNKDDYLLFALFSLSKKAKELNSESLKNQYTTVLKRWNEIGVKDGVGVMYMFASSIINKFSSKVVELGFKERGGYYQGYWRSKIEKSTFNTTKDLLVAAMRNGSLKEYYKLLDRNSTIEAVGEVELNTQSSLTKMLGILQQRAVINSALDFYQQKQLFLEEAERAKSKQKTLNNNQSRKLNLSK